MASKPKEKSKILLFASSSYAGMGPYVISIVNSFKAEDNVRFFLIEREGRYYSRNIREELRDKATIVFNPTPSKLKTLFSVLTRFKCRFRKDIEEICRNENISIVHDLTGEPDSHLVKEINLKRTWLYTVHDLHPHEAKKSFFKEWRQNKIYAGIFKSIDLCKTLITNSESQYQELIEKYPQKDCFKTPFPTLITDTIKNGNKVTSEIKDLKNYILFFGRIEEYKGLSVLIEAFKKVNQEVNLVIAGSGELPDYVDDKRTVVVNRYIDDEEIANLYTNSKCVVYPYLSATQSGVLAVASYFQTPIIASDVPFFREVLGDKYIGLFKSGDSDNLSVKLDYFINMTDELKMKLKLEMKTLYETTYEAQKQREDLLSIYKSILDS